MKLSQLGEFALIERIRRATPSGRGGVLLGIGDDAAWVKMRSRSILITSDLLIQDVHFKLKWTSLFALGHKALAVNLSDIAAMGGKPAYLILALGIPADFTSNQISEFYRGINSLCSKTGVVLVGGDTNVARSLIISVCVIGHAIYTPIRRSGAQGGNDIYVTGTLGDSSLGLKLLQYGSVRSNRGFAAYLVSRHRQPTPRIVVGELIARERLATAMIDISDGLLQDLGHICSASGLGAEIWRDQLPLSPAYRAIAGKDGERHALSGGEDYELLFCARRRDRTRLENLSKRAKVPMTRIGRCLAAKEGISVLDGSGKAISIPVKGYDHFRNSSR
ncbi:MAG: thiamine-phosphate kinase [Deltaproteobacteria bacterium]